jgi:hypothetical protein
MSIVILVNKLCTGTLSDSDLNCSETELKQLLLVVINTYRTDMLNVLMKKVNTNDIVRISANSGNITVLNYLVSKGINIDKKAIIKIAKENEDHNLMKWIIKNYSSSL